MLTATISSAEDWVCYDPVTKEVNKYVQGDCLALGLCSEKDNAGLQPNCFEANKEEFYKAKQGNVKFDGSIISVNRIVDLTSQEIEAKDKPAKDAEAAQKAKIDALKIKLKRLGLNDEETNFIIFGRN